MPSPVPKHLRTPEELTRIPCGLIDHRVTFSLAVAKSSCGIKHPAKYYPGLATKLLYLADSPATVCDPMAGTGRMFTETGISGVANDVDTRMSNYMKATCGRNVRVHNVSAEKLFAKADAVIFSPPYYPRTDRCRPNAHPAHRGEPVGFRDSYGCREAGFIGEPAGKDGILHYRDAMRRVYAAMRGVAPLMVLVTKNWTRLGVELRLDLDTMLTAMEAGWKPVDRHGWTPPASLWAKFNAGRGTGVAVEDVLVFK